MVISCCCLLWNVKKVKKLFSISLPEDLISALDEIAEDSDCSRNEVIKEFLAYCVKDEEIVDEVFPPIEDEEEEETEEDSEEAEAESKEDEIEA